LLRLPRVDGDGDDNLDLLRLAEKDGAIRRAVALHLAEKVKNGAPKQREIAEKSYRGTFLTLARRSFKANNNTEPLHKITPRHRKSVSKRHRKSRDGGAGGI